MTFLAPWALWFAVAGAAVIALYILKIKRQRQTVPALDFWLQLAGRTKVHSLFDRLKRFLSMLLWLLIAACLVFALGNPILSWGRVKPQSIAVIIDNSASMQAIEHALEAGDAAGASTRFDAAKAALAEIASRRPVTDRWLLIDATRTPRVVVPWTYDRKEVVQAADALAPFGGRGDITAAVHLASQLLEGKEEPLIVVLSDGAGGEVAERAAADPRIVHWPLGATRDNLGIVRLSVRFHPQQLNHHALISVANEGDEAIDTNVTLSIDGRTYGVELVHAEAKSTWERTVVIEAPEGGVLTAALDRSDALAADNEAHAILHPIRPAKVWLVCPEKESFFFEQALAAMEPLISAENSVTMTLAQYEAVRGAAAAKAAAGTAATEAGRSESAVPPAPDLVLFNNCMTRLPLGAGSYVVVNALPGDLKAEDLGTIAAPQLFLAPREHPLTQYLNLNGVRMAEARKLRLTDRATVLASSAEGDPLILLDERPQRQTLVIAFDVMQSDMPFRNAFPLLLRNAVAFLHTEAPSWLKDEHAIGETITPLKTLPEAIASVDVTTLRGGATETKAVSVAGGRFSFRDTLRSGALRAQAGEDTAYTVINLCDARESRIAPAVSAGEDPATRLALSRTLFGSMPWLAFASLALLLIALEWMTYSFRWTE
jgi:hypothetical protein